MMMGTPCRSWPRRRWRRPPTAQPGRRCRREGLLMGEGDERPSERVVEHSVFGWRGILLRVTPPTFVRGPDGRETDWSSENVRPARGPLHAGNPWPGPDHA